MSTNEQQYTNYALELRFYPNKEQREYLAQLFGCTRFIYNYCLNKINEQYKETNKFLFYSDTSKILTKLKKDSSYSWLKDVDSTAQQQSLRHLDNGISNFIKSKQGKRRGKSVGFVKFKSKYDKQSCKIINLNLNRGFDKGTIKLDLDNQTLKIPKLKKPLKVVSDKRRPDGIISSITIKKSQTNKYFVSILFKQETQVSLYEPDINNSIGIDFGLKTFITTSNKDEIQSPLFLNKQLKKLRRLSKQHSKKQPKSMNREKARVKLTKQHEKIANQRKNFNHNLSKSLLDKYDFIFIEDLNLEAMKQLWGKKISDLAYAQLVDFLTYKAFKQNKYIVKIDRYFASSKLCSHCGHKNNNLRLSDRTWFCSSCKKIHERDYNASVNILNEGIKNLNNTVGSTGI